MICVETEAVHPANIYRLSTELGMVPRAEDKEMAKAMAPALQELREETDWDRG